MKILYENLSLLNSSFKEEFLSKASLLLECSEFILGKELEEFEKEFASYILEDKKGYAVGVNSGLSALELAFKALELPPQSEVIAPSHTFFASILAIINANLKPSLVEPDISSYNLDPSLIESKITKNTRAILCVHMYGLPCNMEEILRICKKYNLILIEDCAQAHGSKIKINNKFKKVGSFSLSCFSFYPTKNLGGIGDGGIILTSNKALELRLKELRNYGSSKKYFHNRLGGNERLDCIQAAFLRLKLKKLDLMLEHKNSLAKLYFENLNKELILPLSLKNYYNSFHIFPIRFKKRDKLKSFLESKNIFTHIHYKIPLHKQKALKFLDLKDFSIASKIANEELSLPISYGHTKEDIMKVIEGINLFFK